MKKFVLILLLIATACQGEVISRVKETEKFKTYRDGDDLQKFLRDLVIWDENNYGELAGRTNWLIDRDEFKGDVKLIGDEKKVCWYNGDYYFCISASGSMASNVNYTWPPADAGVGGQALLSDAAGVLSWGTPSTSAAHDILSGTHGDAASDAVTRGSIIIGNSTPEWDELTVGTALGGAATTYFGGDGTDVGYRTLAELVADIDSLLDLEYLRLDASNDPLTGNLDFNDNDIDNLGNVDGTDIDITAGTGDFTTTGTGTFGMFQSWTGVSDEVKWETTSSNIGGFTGSIVSDNRGVLNRARRQRTAGSGTYLDDGDIIRSIFVQADKTALGDWDNSAVMEFRAGDDHASGDIPGEWGILLCPDASVTAREVFRMEMDGNAFFPLDNQYANFGIGNDVKIGSDGTNGEIVPVTALQIGDGTTNYTNIDASGRFTLVGDARVEQFVESLNLTGKGGSAPSQRTTEEPYLSWTFAIGEDSHQSFEAPYTMDYTDVVAIKVHWYTSVSQTGDEVAWQAVWNSIPEAGGEAINAGSTTITSADTSCPTQWHITETSIGTIAANSIAQDDIVGLSLERVALAGAGTDPAINTIHVLTVEFEYYLNKLGEPL